MIKSEEEEENFMEDFWISLRSISSIVVDFHSHTNFHDCIWTFLSKEERRQRVFSAIENSISSILIQLEEHGKAEFHYPNLRSWENVYFDPYRGMLPIRAPFEPLQTVCSSHRRNSARKFSLILLTLQKVKELFNMDVFATKRDIYYQNPIDYGSQSNVDISVMVISAMLKIPRLQLRILATPKGITVGSCTFINAQGVQVNLGADVNGISVPQDINGITAVESSAQFILVIEKDSTFQKLLDEGYLRKFPDSILITGKGMPDLNTRQFVHFLFRRLSIPVFLYTDADPYGIEIMCSFRFGSLSMVWNQEEIAVPVARWIGVHPSDIEYVEDEDKVLSLSNTDNRKLESLLSRPYMSHECCQALKQQILRIQIEQKKIEIQAFPSPLGLFIEKLKSSEWV